MDATHYSLAEWLPEFFEQWPENVLRERKAEKRTHIDSAELAHFFDQLAEPLQAVQHRALSFDPWEVAGLGRKEVRNTAVLAWLLDPEGTHGFGRRPLQALLEAIREVRADIPADYHQFCRVQVETNPAGDNTNRVDIEIDADNFFLLVEVKIDAGEQQEQLARYCRDARLRAMSRRWAVVFLTPQGRQPTSIGDGFRPEDVPCFSWRHLANRIELALQSHDTARVNASPSRQMAAHAAFCFLNRAQTF